MNKIKPFPVDKILSLRRSPYPQQQQQQTENMEDVPSFLPRQLSADTAKPQEKPPPKGRWMSASAVDLPPPLRSPMSQANRQRQLHSPNQYITVLKILLGLIAVSTFLSMFLVSRLGENGEREFSPKILILLWNEDLTKMPRRATHTECGCVVTTSRGHFEKPFDAVVFNGDLPYSLEEFSDVNRTGNYLSVFAARNPLSLAQGGSGSWPADDWPSFNLTMTYRLDSQLVWSEYYFSHINKARRLNSFRAFNDHFTDDMPGNRIQLLENQIKKKDRLAMYLIYEVDDASQPQSMYLAELRKYVDLDAHESCVGPSCSHYHFMLIFDSSACPDYVPSQMYKAMYNFVVPVLIGGGNLTNLVPPESYISSRDFPKPQELVAYLERLVNVSDEYQRYFWWHSLYKLRRTALPYCQLCSHLIQSQEEPRIETSPLMDFAGWWTTNQCPKRFTTFL